MARSRGFWLSLVVLLIAWEVYFHASGIGAFFLAPPSLVAERLYAWLVSGRLFLDLGASVLLLLLGLGLAAAIAIPVGLCLGFWRALDRAFGPFLVVAYATPAVVFLPLLLMWFGFGYTARVLIVAVFAVLPILLNVWWGVRALDASWVRVAEVFCANRRELLAQVVFPGSIGHILSSLRVGGGLALIGVFVAEFHGATSGVGYQSIIGAKRMDIAALLSGLLMLGAMGVAFEWALGAVERKWAPWRVTR